MEINKIYLGDAYKLIKEVPDKSVDLIVTDPPYSYDSLSGGGIAGQVEFFKEIQASQIDKGFDYALLDEMVRVCKNINIYIWVSKKQFKPILDYVVDKYKCSWDLIIWKKQNPVPLCNNQYLHDCEYCLWFHKGVRFLGNFDTASTVFITPINQRDKKQYAHPTIKPQEIIETLIKNSCGGGLVFDPFMGSGTTACAAKALGLDYLGFEINPKWHAVAVDRVNGITKKQRDAGIEQLRLF